MVGIIPNPPSANQYRNGHLSAIFHTKTDSCPLWCALRIRDPGWEAGRDCGFAREWKRHRGDMETFHTIKQLLVLLAAVIGPVTATRYRFVMIPFFAILAAHALPH